MNHFHRTMAYIMTVTMLPTTANSDFTFRQVARTGDFIPSGSSSAVASFGPYVSMNDSGQVAFRAKRLDGSEAIVRATPTPGAPGYQFEVVAASNGTFTFSDYVSINTGGEVSYRRRAGTGLAYDIMRDATRIAFGTTATNDPYNNFFKGLMPQTDINTPTNGGEAEVSFYGDVLEPNGYTLHHQIRKGHDSGPQSYYVSHSTLIASQPAFSSFGTSTSINDAGGVLFTGLHSDPIGYGNGIFLGDGTQWFVIASTATGFTTTGSRPSTDGAGNVAFYGARASGSGIYVSSNGGSPRLAVPVGAPVLSVDPATRVLVNTAGNTAFAGTADANGASVRALFRSCAGSAQVVAKAGDVVYGTVPIDGLQLWDGLNASGDVCFWGKDQGGSEAVVVGHTANCGDQVAAAMSSTHLSMSDVRHLSQYDLRWKNICLGEPRCCFQIPGTNLVSGGCIGDWMCGGMCVSPSPCQPCDACNQCTIGKAGCTLTCATMLFNYHVNGPLPQYDATPEIFNGFYVFYNDYTTPEPDRNITNEIDWDQVAAVISESTGRRYANHRIYGTNACNLNSKCYDITPCQIEPWLFCGIPVVLRVESFHAPPGYTTPTHSIVCYGVDLLATDPYERILIRDPNDSATAPLHPTLKTYENKLHCSYADILREDTPGGFTCRIHSPAEIVATDRDGRRTGYDVVTGEFLNDITGASYTAEWDNELDPLGDSPNGRDDAHKLLRLPGDLHGQVTINVYATQTAAVEMQMTARRADGSVASFSSESLDMQSSTTVDRTAVMPVSSDFDRDNDVDLMDFRRLQNCFGGGELPLADGCDEPDLDGNGHVDLIDLMTFVEINLTGPL